MADIEDISKPSLLEDRSQIGDEESDISGTNRSSLPTKGVDNELECDNVVKGTTKVADGGKKEESRVIFINSPQSHAFCNNKIFTAKYNLATFFPKFLFQQFRIYANCFFLTITLLQQIPDVSPMGRLNTLIPFSIMMCVSLIKEVSQDLKRHKGDRDTNQRLVSVQRDKKWTEIMWQDVAVGELVRVDNGGPFPSDLILVSSSEPTGMCYIDTQNLDGETNLKLRQAVKESAHVVTGESLGAFKAFVECELPNRHLYDFSGTITITGQADKVGGAKTTRSGQLMAKISKKALAAKTKSQVASFGDNAQKPVPLGPDQILLRGSTLKNTDWIYGISIYTGKESKLMLNSTDSPLKQTRVERATNIQICYMMLLLLTMAITCACLNAQWVLTQGNQQWYLYYDSGPKNSFIFNLLTFIVLYSNFIPISVQVTLEMVKFQQAIFINWDKDMYYPRTDTPANARTSNLNEELGQIKYLFSDKTGTLTQNIMTFRKCTIAGTMYEDTKEGDDFKGAGVVNALRALEKRCIYLREEDPDNPILEQKEHERDVIAEYLILLGVCHTVIPQIDPDTKEIAYLASSPDEAALVSAAATMQHVFTSRTPNSCFIKELGVNKTYQILNVLEFTSKRKRMSVIVKTPEGKLKLYCKGADNVILERLGSNQFVDVTLGHLEIYAKVGLRTLCLSYVDISPEFYKDWANTFYLASTALKDREIKLEDAAELIETNLTLLGATAIEDKLQEGVPETIHNLAQADIKIWILTGDKQETAINIGFSCKLLTQHMDLVIVNEDTLDGTKKSLLEHKAAFGDMLGKDNLAALIIDGASLRHAYTPTCRGDFLAIAMSCKAVVCCRVSPLQKAEIVELVKNSQDAVTLAIGDGANDVGMIQAAHVGIGISGEEGLQAASASDYSIGQFRFLQKLLLVHGAWSYSRVAKLVLYCFYKNVVLYLTQFWFQLYNGFSGQILYEKWTISLYNLFFTSVPPLAIGLFDRYCSMETMMTNPLLYKDSQTGKLFNNTVFWLWIFNAIFHSVVIWTMTAMMYRTGVAWPNGQGIDSYFVGNVCYTYAIVVVCLKSALEMTAWTWLTHVAIWGSMLSWALFVPLYSNFFQCLHVAPEFVGMGSALMWCPSFWFGMVLVPTTCLLRDVVWKVIKRDVFKTHRHAIQEMEKAHKSVDLETAIKKKISAKDLNYDRPRISTGTRKSMGYAFAQEEQGAVSQAQVIRSYDTSKAKPTGE